MQIPTAHLKAALLFAAKKDVRSYLNGVLIEWNSENVTIVATDGHRLFAATHSIDEPVEPGSVIVSYDDVKRALTGYKAETIEFTPNDSIGVRLQHGLQTATLGSVSFLPSDGTYPDWRRVVPAKISGEAAQFDPAYVGDLAKASKALAVKSSVSFLQAHIYHNGMDCALVTFGDREDCFAILMPMRAGSTNTDQHALNVASAVSRPISTAVTSEAA
jgi:DNA polymerase-3 subunit beta